MRTNPGLLLVAAITFLTLQAMPETIFERGYVTAIRSPWDFDVNGYRVILTAQTRLLFSSTANHPAIHQPYLGQLLRVDGEIDRQANKIMAEKIQPALPQDQKINSVAIIDALAETSATPDTKAVRADGYILLLPATADLRFAAPLTSTSPLTPNLWIHYRGQKQEDGAVVVEEADISINAVNPTEDKLRTKSEFDAAAVDKDDKQSGLSKAFLGVDRKRVPAWKDPATQARIEKIGESLVPAYQKQLTAIDPTHIDFRFQVVDYPRPKEALSMESGIILIPHQVIERLENDSQVAAILADSIAEVLEKQAFRARPAQYKIAAAGAVGAAAGAFVPGLGLATGVAAGAAGEEVRTRQFQQSSRVSLWLLHDAGYDITQAPLAWWRLSARKGKDLAHTALPDRALFLYESLGTTWHITPNLPTGSRTN